MEHKFTLEEINEVRTKSNNKKMIWVDNNLRLVFKTIIDKTLRNYNGIPLSWEDIYYEFLYLVPDLFDKYNPLKGIKIKTYLGIKCKYFTLNKCKHYIKNGHKILNSYVSVEKSGVTNRLMDSKQPEIKIDISILNIHESLIYDRYIIDGYKVSEIKLLTGFSRYKINQLIKDVKTKLLVQIKN